MSKRTRKTAPAPPKSADVVSISADDAKTIRQAQAALDDVHRQLGSLREQYRAEEAALLQAAAKSRADMQTMAATIGRKLGIDVDAGGYNFDTQTMQFTRRR